MLAKPTNIDRFEPSLHHLLNVARHFNLFSISYYCHLFLLNLCLYRTSHCLAAQSISAAFDMRMSVRLSVRLFVTLC